MSKYLAFDLETCSWPEEGHDWKAIRPLGISCIGLMGTGWDEPEVYYAGMSAAVPEPRPMNDYELDTAHQIIHGSIGEYKLVGWNSLQFDLACIYDELVDVKNPHAHLIQETAMDHIDPMFQIFCTFGWPVGLEAVSKGLGLPGKLKEEASGANAPEMWMEGTQEDRGAVLRYVGQDAKATLDIVEVGIRTEHLRWRSKKGRPYSLPFNPPMTNRS